MELSLANQKFLEGTKGEEVYDQESCGKVG